MARETGEALSRPGRDLADWIPATVPGTVLGALVDAGVHDDPYAASPPPSQTSPLHPTPRLYTYWWVRDFELPARSGVERVWLDFAGVNHRADVFVNGRRVAAGLEGPYRRHSLDVTAAVRDGANRVAVRVVPPWPPGVPDPGFAGGDHNARNLGESVTRRVTVGWDRLPPVADRNTGLWGGVELRVTGPLRLRDPHVVTYVMGPDGVPTDRATVLLSADVHNPGSEEVRAVLAAHLVDTGQVVERGVVLAPGQTSPVALPDVAVMFPHLWWPNGLGGSGPRSLYTVDLELSIGGVVSDHQRVRFGIREIGWRVDELRDGRGGILSVNGRGLFLRGGTWVGTDALLRRRLRTPRRYRDEVRLHAEAGLNLLRLWGPAAADEAELLAACDEHGLLVMHELWRSAEFDGPYPDGYAERFLASARDTVRRLRNHPSLALWCGGDRVDAEPAKGATGRIDHCLRCHLVGRDREDKPCRFTGHMPCDGDGVIDGTRPYLPSSRSLLGVRGLARGLPGEERYGETRHGGDGEGGAVSAGWAGGAGQDDSDGERPAALVEMHRVQAQLEAAAARMWKGDTGIVLGPTHEPQPGTGGVLYDWWLRQRGGFYGARRTGEPVHLQLDPAAGDALRLVNLGDCEVTGTARLVVYDPSGRRRFEAEREMTAVAIGVSPAYEVEWPADLPPVHLVSLRFRDDDGTVLSDHLDWRSASGASDACRPLDETAVAALADLPAVELEVGATVQRDGGEVLLRATLRNPETGAVAAGVRLRLLRGDGSGDGPEDGGLERGPGAPIHPVFLSDDHFTLLPGGERTVTLRCAAEDAGDADPVLEVGGLNVDGARPLAEAAVQ